MRFPSQTSSNPSCLLTSLFLLLCASAALVAAEPEALPEPDPQVAAGGGVAATTLAPSQMPAKTYVGSLFTINGVTSAVWKDITVTFATTALGTWDLGPTPKVGTIGLGTIQGTVGKVKTKTKRAAEATPEPAP